MHHPKTGEPLKLSQLLIFQSTAFQVQSGVEHTLKLSQAPPCLPELFQGLSSQTTPPGHKGFGSCVVMQLSRNKITHALNGNTVLLPEHLIPHPTQSQPSYDRSTLLKFFSRKNEPSTLGFVPVTLQTTPPCLSQQSPSKRKAVSRTGRRIKVFNPATQPQFYKPKKHVSPRDKNLGVYSNSNFSAEAPAPTSASTRHTGHLRVIEERPQPMGGVYASQQGASRRRLRRQSYRRWCRECKQHVPGGADSLLATPPTSTKVSQNKAAKFKHAIDWQQHLQRKKKPTRDRIQTTPPLAYNYKLRVGAQNVQGLAGTLKLKNLILMMSEHNLDILILSETKSTFYYSYTSEQHLVIQSGNHKDRYAGVGRSHHTSQDQTFCCRHCSSQ